MGQQILKDLEQAKKSQPKAVQHPKPQPNKVNDWLAKEATKSGEERNRHIRAMNKGIKP